jgi:anthranilate synthase component 1
VLANAFIRDSTEIDQSYDAAVSAVEAVVEKLRRPGPSDPIDARAQFPTLQPECNQTRTEFEGAVEQAREFIGRGDIFQVVLSQRFKAPCQADALDLYRSLRMINPSPYMFCLRFGDDFSLVGSSPEMHIRVTRGKIEVRPIAGTRRRGATAEEDAARAAELLSDPKERAEHVMLVDLARNDIGRVSDYGSVRVTEYMTVERYSHVMHIVSHVTGRLRADVTPYDALRATFPAGTVSGAPKIRAMQIISELEPTRRGCYAGVVAYIGFDGGFDSCIALRSVVLKNGEAFVQAGAGVVADSSPSAEYHETISKAGAVLEAIARVAHLRKS